MNELIVFGLQMSLTGLTVVFVALILISLLVASFGPLDRMLNPSSEEKKPVHHKEKRLGEMPKPSEETKTEDEEQLTPELVAVISAAIAVATQKKVRVMHVKRRASSAPRRLQGRATMMATHNFKASKR